MLTIKHQSCEYLNTPLGVDVKLPRLSWSYTCDAPGFLQTAYRICASSSIDLLNNEDFDLWDSGLVNSDASTHIEYGGKSPGPGRIVYWRISIYDKNDDCLCSGDASFLTGLSSNDWSPAQWICDGDADGVDSERAAKAPYLKTVFSTEKEIVEAWAFAACGGWCELKINDKKIDTALMNPAFTRYDRRVLYNTFDLKDCILSGQNTIVAQLGNGFYNQMLPAPWKFDQAVWRDVPKLLFKAIIKYSDGTTEEIVSDDSWQCASSPIVFNAVRQGEIYDARLDDIEAEWTAAAIANPPAGKLVSQLMQPVEIYDSFTAVKVTEPAANIKIFDFGRNLAGVSELSLQNAVPGTEITLRGAEKLGDDGLIDLAGVLYGNSDAKDFQVDKYIASGKPNEKYHAKFAYQGFQYIQTKNLPDAAEVKALRAGTGFKTIGNFECSNELINKIQEAAQCAYRDNFFGLPTDCPTREKNGWTHDAHLASETGLLNFDSAPAYTKWLNDFADEQQDDGSLPGIIPTGGWGYAWGNGPVLDSAYFLIPWYMYLYRGDTRIIETHYQGMKKYVDYVYKQASSHQRKTDNYLLTQMGLGDWAPPSGMSSDNFAPKGLVVSSFFRQGAELVSRFAEVLGMDDDCKTYATLAGQIKDDMNSMYFNQRNALYGNGSQTAQACAIYHKLPPVEKYDDTARQLVSEVERHAMSLNCGVHGTKWLLRALSESGYSDIAWNIVSNREYPGWGHWIEQGATTLWEHWSGTSSRNHIMFGDVSAWLFSYIAGIRPDMDNPGFKNIIFEPYLPEGLDYAKAEHESMYGTIEAELERSGDKVSYNISVPPNSTARVKFGDAIHNITSGKHNFKI